MIQYFKRDGDKAMHKNKEGLLHLHPLPILPPPNLTARLLMLRLLDSKPLPMLIPL
jgi:hypothetical protein